MKSFLFSLLFVVMLLSSCNHCPLEWWESVNTPQKRMECLGRNDDSGLEMALFQKMEKIEMATSYKRQESWVKSGNPLLVGVSILYYILIALLIILGIVGIKHPIADNDAWSFALTTGIIAIIAVGISIPFMLYVDNATTKAGTINFWQLFLLVGLILCVPSTLKMMDRAHFVGSELEFGSMGFIGILPMALFLGVFFRKLATIGSYLFLLCMLVEFVLMLVKCIKYRTSFISSFFILFYVFFVGFGSVFVFYSALSTVSYIAFWIVVSFFVIGAIYGLVTDPQSLFDYIGGGVSSYSDSSDSGSTSFSMESMRNTYATDADGDDIYQNADGRYYKHTWSGWQETEKPS